MFGKISLNTLPCGLFIQSKVNRTHITAVSLVYTFGSYCSDTVVPFHSVLWICETRSQTYRNPVQLEQNWSDMFPFASQPDVQHSSTLAVGGLSERGGYYIAMHCLSLVKIL